MVDGNVSLFGLDLAIMRKSPSHSSCPNRRHRSEPEWRGDEEGLLHVNSINWKLKQSHIGLIDFMLINIYLWGFTDSTIYWFNDSQCWPNANFSILLQVIIFWFYIYILMQKKHVNINTHCALDDLELFHWQTECQMKSVDLYTWKWRRPDMRN